MEKVSNESYEDFHVLLNNMNFEDWVMNKLKIAVIFTCYNRIEKTKNCLEKITKQGKKLSNKIELEIFCCDDNSTDGTYEMIHSRFNSVNLILGTGNLFWAKGMAKAIEEAEKSNPDFYLMINDDVDFFEDALEIMLSSYDSVQDRYASIVGSTKDKLTGKLTYGGIKWDKKVIHEKETRIEPRFPCVKCEQTNWNCFLIPSCVYNMVGTIDDYFEHSMADYDYSNRICRKGFPIYVAKEYIGYCSRNSIAGTWQDTSLGLVARLKALQKKTGIPPRSSWHYCKKYYGIFAPLVFIRPYISIVKRSLILHLKSERNDRNFTG
ncbi:glycosyltransferase family 2 protein [Clostridium oryzae]|uniref:Glycosyl transferase family 2 n=1 Tax=Clostridium oryzae TaxID=1450648 RepID=A0A1V4IRQ7_9CLOT|nr:glycosyltransferase [Clostridium oryzae]OPJ62708.1 glycosyl transferase family 2 [Clostridium oryzae]